MSISLENETTRHYNAVIWDSSHILLFLKKLYWKSYWKAYKKAHFWIIMAFVSGKQYLEHIFNEMVHLAWTTQGKKKIAFPLENVI